MLQHYGCSPSESGEPLWHRLPCPPGLASPAARERNGARMTGLFTNDMQAAATQLARLDVSHYIPDITSFKHHGNSRPRAHKIGW
ncbi:hypothetical protein GX50_05542 [[Emmonsia] crescens]|uniref:Uncharacterized protein n=1 Tax=[Emmonsia] crescens TaxID=73230 RepID=A0A2B7ZFC2_9EURO|nr:hypothetical protein GX50_05542 [Emmonsia crescens]